MSKPPTPSRNPSEYRLGRNARESFSGVLSAGLEQEKNHPSHPNHTMTRYAKNQQELHG